MKIRSCKKTEKKYPKDITTEDCLAWAECVPDAIVVCGEYIKHSSSFTYGHAISTYFVVDPSALDLKITLSIIVTKWLNNG